MTPPRVLLVPLVAGATAGALAGWVAFGPVLAPVGAVAGLTAMLASWRRRRRASAIARTRRLAAALPDALELLASAVDGGAATDAALRRVAEFADPELGEVLRTALAADDPAGSGVALRRADPALRPLGSLLQQTDELGVPIAGALRLLAADQRLRARTEARERAAAAAPKMLLVVGGLLAPAALLVVIGGQVLAMRELVGPVLG
ncbi:MAG: type II secretion system F family protein [Gaiellales bacterium]